MGTTGRPRDEELSDTILDATIELIGEVGYGVLNVAAVAERAGVHRPAIYRRWPSKLDLVMAALRRLKQPPPDRDTGDVREDLLAFLVDSGYTEPPDRQIACVLRLHSEMFDHPELREALEHDVVGPRRDLLEAIIRRGIERGQVRADLDVPLTLDMLLGLVQHRRAQADPILKPSEVDGVVNLVLGDHATHSSAG